MINDQILGYIKGEQAKGSSIEIIKKNLMDNGWSSIDVDEAYKALNISYSMGVHQAEQKIPVAPSVSLAEKPSLGRWKNILFGLIVVVVLSLGAFGVYAYYSGYFTPLSKTLFNAINSARNAKSVSFDLTIKADISDFIEKNLDQVMAIDIFSSKVITFNALGFYDINDINNTKSESIITIGLGDFFGEIEYKFVDKTFYAKLNKSPASPLVPDTEKYKNNWYHYSFKDGENEEGLVKTIAENSPLGVGSQIMDKLSDEEKEQIKNISYNAKFFKVTKKMSPEEINGVLTYHFMFDLDYYGILSYAQELEDYIRSVGNEDSFLSSFSSVQTVEGILNNTKNFSGEAWVGRNDSLPYKIMINFDQGIQDEGLININLVALFKDWNKPMSVVIPEKSTSFEELFKELLSSFDVDKPNVNVKKEPKR